MDAGKQILSDEKRKTKSKEVSIQFVILSPDRNYFSVLDDEGSKKYIGGIMDRLPHIEDYCTCPDQTNRNTDTFMANNGYAMQCKHLMQAREQRFGAGN